MSMFIELPLFSTEKIRVKKKTEKRTQFYEGALEPAGCHNAIAVEDMVWYLCIH